MVSRMSSRTEKFQRNLAWAVLASESTHVFCCVIPTIVTLISVLASMGVIASVPVFMFDFHEILHRYEIPIIAGSGFMLGLGWVLYAISRRIECQKPHCEPHVTVCGPQKNNSRTVLWAATIIFLVNITVYSTIHVALENRMHDQAVAAHVSH
jgi:hypothetical protein